MKLKLFAGTLYIGECSCGYSVRTQNRRAVALELKRHVDSAYGSHLAYMWPTDMIYGSTF